MRFSPTAWKNARFWIKFKRFCLIRFPAPIIILLRNLLRYPHRCWIKSKIQPAFSFRQQLAGNFYWVFQIPPRRCFATGLTCEDWGTSRPCLLALLAVKSEPAALRGAVDPPSPECPAHQGQTAGSPIIASSVFLKPKSFLRSAPFKIKPCCSAVVADGYLLLHLLPK